MGGDLNLKKSWHPQLISNQRKVWEEEKKALEERKKVFQVMKERAEERQIQELQEMQEAAGGKKRLNRVDWMYAPSAGQTGPTEEMEGYLLGKRRVDSILKHNITKHLEQATSGESPMALQHANTMRDTASKIRDDPMLAIKKQEQQELENMMKDPVKRKALLKAMGQEDTKEDTTHRHRKHRHHRDKSQDRHNDRKHGDRQRDRDDYKRDRDRRRDRDGDRHSRRDRSRSPYRGSDRHSRRKSSPYRQRERSRSPTYHRRKSSSPSNSPRRDKQNRRHSRDRSSSIDDRVKGDDRTRSPDRSTIRHSRRREPVNSRFRSQSPSYRQTKPKNGSRPNTSALETSEDERSRKLAAMQEAASDLDQDRENRLKMLAERESAERQAEDAARSRTSKYGGKGNFLSGINKRVGELGVGERISRGRVGYDKDVD